MKTNKNNSQLPKRKDWPTSCDAAVLQIVERLDINSRELIIETKFDNLINFNRIWGMRIRNNFGLWRGNHDLMQSCLNLRNIESYDPDIVSLIIIEEVWKKLKGY